MAEIFLRRTLSGLAADDAEASEYLRKIPMGVTLCCKVRKARSVPQLRYYFALCELCSTNSDVFQTKDQVDQFLRMEAGHVDLISVGGVVYKLPRSLSFTKLSQDEWAAFLQRARDAVVHKILPGVAMPELEEEIARMAA